jgi:hypothetical protein
VVSTSRTREGPSGQLIYDTQLRTTIDDRALAHLQIVLLDELRRREGFAFSWKNPSAEGDGRSTIWIAPGLSLRFRYAGSRPPAISGAWVRALAVEANAPAGLHLVPEPAATSPTGRPATAVRPRGAPRAEGRSDGPATGSSG